MSRLFLLLFLSPLCSIAHSQTESEKNLQEELDKMKALLEDEKQKTEDLQQKAENLEGQLKSAGGQLQEEAQAAGQKAAASLQNKLNEFKYVDLSFGILPNDDKKVNNLSTLRINYSPTWHSSLTYYQNTSTKTENYTEDQEYEGETYAIDTDETGITERVNFNLRVIEYTTKVSEGSISKFEITTGLGLDYYTEDNSYRFTQRASQDGASYIGNGTETDDFTTLAPELGVDLKYRSLSGLTITGTAAVLIANSNTNKWSVEGGGSANFPDEENSGSFTRTPIDYNESEESTYTSNGYRVAAGFHWVSQAYGGIGANFERAETAGESEAFEREENDSGESIVSRTKGKETRVRQQAGISYSLDFLESYGVIPVLKVANNIRTIDREGADTEADRNINQTEYGIIFKY